MFYVIFGVSGDELAVSKTKHHVDEFPQGLDMRFFEGTLGNVLKEADSELYDKCKVADKCAIIRGTVENDETFDYMKNVIGFIQAFIDQGAYGILDLLTFSLIPSQKRISMRRSM